MVRWGPVARIHWASLIASQKGEPKGAHAHQSAISSLCSLVTHIDWASLRPEPI